MQEKPDPKPNLEPGTRSGHGYKLGLKRRRLELPSEIEKYSIAELQDIILLLQGHVKEKKRTLLAAANTRLQHVLGDKDATFVDADRGPAVRSRSIVVEGCENGLYKGASMTHPFEATLQRLQESAAKGDPLDQWIFHVCSKWVEISAIFDDEYCLK